MKSKVFKKAWEMFKELGITFSMALKLSWANATADKLANDMMIAEGIAFNRNAVKSIESKLNNVLIFLKEFTPCGVSFEPRKPYNNSGARFDYGLGIYNGD